MDNAQDNDAKSPGAKTLALVPGKYHCDIQEHHQCQTHRWCQSTESTRDFTRLKGVSNLPEATIPKEDYRSSTPKGVREGLLLGVRGLFGNVGLGG